MTKKIHKNIMKKIRTHILLISFTIQFQTLIFVISANRAIVRVVRKILEIWCTCNILVKPCIISSFLTLYLCPNTSFTYVRTLLSYLSFLLRLCALPRYYFEFLNSLPVSEHFFYLCSNPFELPKFLLRLCALPR